LLRIRGGRVLLEKRGFGTALLKRLARRYARGPARLSPEEVNLRKHWARKMLQRIRRADAEGKFRRAWLLTTLLEDYFVLRGLWYEGSKLSLRWLRRHEPAVASLFTKALRLGAKLSCIVELAAVVTAVPG